MLKTIIKKEFLGNITSLRFFLTLLLIIVVFSASGFVFVSRYQQAVDDFSAESNKNLSGLNENSSNLSKAVNFKHTYHIRPKVTQLFCDGYETWLPNTFVTDIYSIENPRVTGRGNFLLSLITGVDWVFIISIILSFTALLTTYDSFSAERERGTLSLIIANPVPRDTIILGKYISAVMTLMIPLFIGLLINLIIIGISGVVISVNEWVKIVFFIGVSLGYLSVFLLLGMLLSSRSSKSSISVVVILFAWILLVIIIPASGRIISENILRIPLRSEVDKRINRAGSDIWNNSENYGWHAGWWSNNWRTNKNLNPPARERLFAAITDAKNRINEEYINQIIEQANLGRKVTKISPVVIYQSASEAIIGTGIARFQDMYRQLQKYKEILMDFYKETDREDPESGHFFIPGHSSVLSQNPVDYNSIPKFSAKDVSMGDALKTAAWDIGLLFFINILLFLAVYVSFLRCDVRQR